VEFSSERRFGCEFECISPLNRDQTARALQNVTGLQVVDEEYTHRTTSHWKIVYDVTVRPSGRQQGYGIEVVSPPLRGLDGLSEVKRMALALDAIGCVVNRGCGFHVHHEVAGLTYRHAIRAVATYKRFADVIDEGMPISRRDGQYCGSLRNNGLTVAQLRDCADSVGDRGADNGIHGVIDAAQRETGIRPSALSHRYYTVSTSNLGTSRQTVEFRQHQGTVNWIKATNWIALTQMFINHTVNKKRMVGATTPLQFKRWITGQHAASDNAVASIVARWYMLRRRAQIARDAGKSTTINPEKLHLDLADFTPTMGTPGVNRTRPQPPQPSSTSRMLEPSGNVQHEVISNGAPVGTLTANAGRTSVDRGPHGQPIYIFESNAAGRVNIYSYSSHLSLPGEWVATDGGRTIYRIDADGDPQEMYTVPAAASDHAYRIRDRIHRNA
jgi:hypothetical protein